MAHDQDNHAISKKQSALSQKMERVTPDELRRLLTYDESTGVLTWKYRERSLFDSEAHWRGWNKKYYGKRALNTMDDLGYPYGSVWGAKIRAHTVIWLMVHGKKPNTMIDHINGNRADNRIVNLREVTQKENCKNSAKNIRCKSGVGGVDWVKSILKWRARIYVDGVETHLGVFDDFEEAVKVRKLASIKHGYSERHGV